MRFRSTAALAAASIMLAACSGEPSSADVKAAFEQAIAQVNRATQAIAGSSDSARKMLQTTLYDAKKIACKKADGYPGYRCDVEIDIESPLIGRTKQVDSVRLVKGDKGWQVMQ